MIARRLLPCLLAAAALLTACSSASVRQDGAQAANQAAAQALAASAPPEGQPLAPWLAAERKRIEAGRKTAAQNFETAEKACWQRFVVNACLHQARVDRRAVLDRLRQEDLALNEVERQRRTAARLRELEEKGGQVSPE
jgi:hypothetical protein